MSDSNEENIENVKNILKYKNDILSILEIFDFNKKIFEKFIIKDYKKNFINIIEFAKQNKQDDIPKITKILNELISYQNKIGYLFLELKPDFWKFYLDNFIEKKLENINKLIELRKCLKNYQSLTQNKKVKVNNEQKKIADYIIKDDYGIAIHTGIEHIIKTEKLDDLQKLNLLFKTDPIYLEESKKKQIKSNILKEFDFKNIQNEEFFTEFRELKLDRVFENIIDDFFNYIFSLIKNIYDFELLFRLFDIEKLSEKGIKVYIKCLQNKFEEIDLTIDKNKQSDFDKLLKIIATLIDIILKKQSQNVIKFFQILEKNARITHTKHIIL